MDHHRATEIASDWRNACSYDPNIDRRTWAARERTLQRLLLDAVPDLDVWAVHLVRRVTTGEEARPPR